MRKLKAGSGPDGSESSFPLLCSPQAAYNAMKDNLALLSEVRTLVEYIDKTRRDVASLGANEVVKSHVMTATDELDAIVMHTAEATSTILDVCETLDSAPMLVALEVVSVATARIYEACSFQDITGQRVAKVVQTLQAIELKLAEILRVFGDGPAAVPADRASGDEANRLLNGPQHPRSAMDQRAIDAMLENDP